MTDSPRPPTSAVHRLYRARLVQQAIRIVAPEAFFAWYCRQQGGGHANGGAAYTLSFDCEGDADVDALASVLGVLASRGVRASFAVIGRLVERFPDVHRRIVDAGHEILNHTYSHPEPGRPGLGRWFHDLSLPEQREEIVRCHEVCVALLGYDPVGFRAPHFGETHRHEIYALLRELGYRYSSSTISVATDAFGRPFLVDRVWEVPLACSAVEPFLIFDSWTGFRRFPRPAAFVDALARTLRIAISAQAYVSHYFDPDAVTRAQVLEPMCDVLRDVGAPRVAPYREILALDHDIVAREPDVD